MTEDKLQRLLQYHASSASNSISTETGLRAAEIIGQTADKLGIDWALAGGIAMHLYGFTRATKDVDVIASAVLPLESKMHLSFGGESYEVEVGETKVTVDWIVRDDLFIIFYESALKDALDLAGRRVVSPEWLAILKYAAKRPKDSLDLRFLLQDDDLIDLPTLKKHLLATLGELGAEMPFQEIERLAFEERSLKTFERNPKYIQNAKER